MRRPMDATAGRVRGSFGRWVLALVVALALGGLGREALAGRSTAIVVDFESGAILHAKDPDAAVYPASLTKTMTLYLLFEALDPDTFDALVLVDAPAPVRKDRLVEARGLSPTEADDLIAAQAPSADKRARSHFVIDNDGSRDALERRTREVWTELQARAGVA